VVPRKWIRFTFVVATLVAASEKTATEVATTNMSILIVAAMDRELKPLLPLRNDDVQCLKTGVGEKNVRLNLGRFLEKESPEAVIGIGFAGGLSRELKMGDLVIGSRIHRTTLRTDSALLSVARDVKMDRVFFGAIVSVPEIASETEAKQALAADLQKDEPGCVDMESYAIQQICAEQKIPFLAVRAITDTVNEIFPLDLNSCRDATGNIRAAKVLMKAVRKPAIFPGLMKLRSSASVCAERLSLFVEQLLELLNTKKINLASADQVHAEI